MTIQMTIISCTERNVNRFHLTNNDDLLPEIMSWQGTITVMSSHSNIIQEFSKWCRLSREVEEIAIPKSVFFIFSPQLLCSNFFNIDVFSMILLVEHNKYPESSFLHR